MIFAPQNSVVRKIYDLMPDWIRRPPITPANWSLELQKLEGHTDRVEAVAFSPDGSLLASGSGGHTVQLCDVGMGQEVQKLESHTERVETVAF
jgi:WD40 repeat protein